MNPRPLWRALALAVLFVVLAPAIAFAQGSGGEEFPTGAALIVASIFLVVSVGINVLQWVAPKTKTTIDDRILEALQWVERNRGQVEDAVGTVARFRDPTDPLVPSNEAAPAPAPPAST